ncbi:hypothetical protein DWF00_07170 [Bosea caraganae]|uniref:Uncharacterized protein n=1 Tax=Bosea caraganae TaxID=2763117 RepID=A0A370L0V6_9HYPH|nr:hypothetical protein [Bosea caraganae]RDJ20999.1 hypothetical protein DWE98_21965 [Bosea caraganae]RDJ28498.1 hypothetical protein DWF00_07170 [Bosea caraganae]
MTKRAAAFAALPFALSFFAAAGAQAQSCADNFKSAGVPMVTAITYRTWDLIPNRKPAVVLSPLARAIAADGFGNIEVDKAGATVSAMQETSGSGRPQFLKVTAKTSGPATRVDMVFTVQPGQIANEPSARAFMCRVIAAARR